MRKLKRDVVVSIDDNGYEIVGVYYVDEDANEERELFQCDPEIADEIIEVWNKAVENQT